MFYHFKKGTLVGAVLVLLPEVASACEHCFGASADSMTGKGIAFAMLTLLGFIGLVGTGVGSFFFRLSRRAEKLKAGDLSVSEYGDLVPTRSDSKTSELG